MPECPECKRELNKGMVCYIVHYAGATAKVCSLPCALTALQVPLGRLSPDANQTPFRIDVQMVRLGTVV